MLHALNADQSGTTVQISHAHAQLVLRSINTSRSAFVSVTYQEDFFDAYDMSGATIVQGSLPLKVHKGALVACTKPSSTNMPFSPVILRCELCQIASQPWT